MTTIYVGNLPSSSSESQVRDVFSSHGTVHSVKLITDRFTGELRGFGFVELDDPDALAAIDALNHSELDGQILRVDESQETIFKEH